MDPVTVASLVLGVLPLLISVFENYETVFQPFVTFRRSSKEVSRFLISLDAQRTIFVNECQLMLLAASHGHHSIDILRNPDHPLRTDATLEDRLGALLGTSREVCLRTLTLIKESLEKLTLETQDLDIVLRNRESGIPRGLSVLRQRIKISFSKTRFDDTLRDLRSHNDDLRTLSRQMRELSTHQIAPKPAYIIRQELASKIRMTQEASTRLYEVLACKWSCQESAQHTACMSLNVGDESRRQAPKSMICFNVALTCISEESSASTKALWLDVESSKSGIDTSQNTNNDKPIDPLAKAIQDICVTRRTVPHPSGSISQASELLTTSLPPDLDLGTVESLCRYFHARIQESPDEESCLGVLERAQTFCYFLYPDTKTRQESDDLQNLEQLLQSAALANIKYNWVMKLKLARLLALSIIRFWSSPWLDEEWMSTDIYFPDPIGNSRRADLSFPFIMVRLSEDANVRRIRKDACVPNSASTLARNRALFRLGVILLELGYDAPIGSLREEQDHRGNASNEYVDFFTARRLALTVSRKFNAKYGKLVSKCLYCDFGVGAELASSELQSAVIVDVVLELDQCLRAIQEGLIGSDPEILDAQSA